MRPHLHFREWLVIFCVTTSLLILGVVSFFRGRDDFSFQSNDDVYVVVDGAVSNTEGYLVKPGSRVKDLLSQIHLLPEADLKKIKKNARLYSGQYLYIPQKNRVVEVYIDGAVKNSGVVRIKKGKRLSYLLDNVKATANADLESLPLHMRLQGSETIVVPEKEN